MKTNLFILFVLLTAFAACAQENASPEQANPLCKNLQSAGNTIASRFPAPSGYARMAADSASFGYYLRHLPLKPPGSPVLLFNGVEKGNSGAHVAVVDMEIGNRDLQQCADAIMRLRAEYLFARGEYSEIHFNLTNGFRTDYTRWREGYRVKVSGNTCAYVKSTSYSDAYAEFRKYLDFVFTYAGTLSLAKELNPIPLAELQPGDIFIQGGSPGHAVLVADVAVNTMGEKVFLLVQSYMPAQEIHLLCNPVSESLSPWYEINPGQELLITPEWSFDWSSLKRFP